MHGRPLSAAALVLLLLAALPAGASAQAQLTPVGAFSSPVFVAAPPGDSRRLFVVERDGHIRVIRDGQVLAEPFLNIDPDVQSGGEEGLLSMAFAPDYAASGRFYVYYTGNDGDNRVEEFHRAADSLERADPASRRLVLELFHPGQGNHNGGQLQFGPDGFLYISTGDGGGGNDPNDNGQRLTGTPQDGNGENPLLGKILRIDPAGGQPYAIPPGNPFGAGGTRPEIWAYGLRNPWRFSFDRGTGDLVIGDVGQGLAEEVDYSPRSSGGGAGANYGWRCYEGRSSTPGVPDCEPPGHVLPVLERFQSDGWCAIVGGYVARDPSLGSLNGRYLWGDNCRQEIHATRLATPEALDTQDTGLRVPQLSSFGEDACGRVYAASLTGPVFRIEGAQPAGCSLPDPYPPPAPPPAVDVDPPGLRLRASKRQRILRRRGVVLRARCDEPCSLSFAGRISIPRGPARVFKLRPARRSGVVAGTRVRVKLRLRKRAVRPLRRALARRDRVRARVSVRAKDAAGNARGRKRTVRARR